MAAGRAAGQPGEGEEAGELERESRQPEQAGQVPHTHCIQLLKGQRDWDVSKHTCGQSWSVLREAWKLCRSSLLPLFLWFQAKTAVPCHVPSKPSLRVAFAAQILPALLFPSKITWLAHAVRPSRQWCQVQGLRPAQWGACQVPARGPCSMWKSLVFKYGCFAFMFCSFLMETAHAPWIIICTDLFFPPCTAPRRVLLVT